MSGPSVTTAERVGRIFGALQASPGSQTRQASVVDALESLGPSAIPSIERHLQFDHERERLVALMALQRLNEQRTDQDFSDEIVRVYLAQLSDEQVLVRTYAMEALIRAGSRFRDQVMQYREHADAGVRTRLEIVLRELR